MLTDCRAQMPSLSTPASTVSENGDLPFSSATIDPFRPRTENEVTTTHKRSLCFFETDTGKPISRHSAPFPFPSPFLLLRQPNKLSRIANREYVAVTRDIEFVMRAVNTIGVRLSTRTSS